MQFGLIPVADLANPGFWSGLLSETLIGIVAVNVLVGLYRLGCAEEKC
jgi:hypothetical protein